MFFKEFFYFQKSDRKVLIVALCLATLALGVIFWVGNSNLSTPAPDDEDSLSAFEAGEAMAHDHVVGTREVRLVPFDPNTADSTVLLGLGLQPWQVRNILKYRAKGGVYRQPEDFARVYGLTVKQYREMAPYIRISPDYRPAAEVYGHDAYTRHSQGNRGKTTGSADHVYAHDGRSFARDSIALERRSSSMSRDTLLYPVKIKVGEHIDLNVADTTMLKKVPGIGSFYARKVVGYRERLGGFSSLEQLMEIEGFPEDALDFLELRTLSVRKMNLNRLSLAQLRKHPYINFYQAKAITDYRRLKGPLHSLSDLSLLPDFPPEVIRRLQPYVEF